MKVLIRILKNVRQALRRIVLCEAENERTLRIVNKIMHINSVRVIMLGTVDSVAVNGVNSGVGV